MDWVETMRLIIACQIGLFYTVFAKVLVTKRENIHARSSALVTIASLIFVQAMIVHPGLVPGFYIACLFCWSSAFGIYIFSRTAIRHAIKKKGKLKQREMKEAGNSDDLASKNEMLRKLFHLSGFLLVILYFMIAPAMAPFLSRFHSFDSIIDGVMTITLFTLVAGLVVVSYIDVQRILFGEEYGMRHAQAIFREKEIGAVGAQTFLLAGSTVAWIAGMLFQPLLGTIAVMIPLSVVVISTLADGMAAIIGKAKGRHKVKRSHGQMKSIEGFVAGFVTALIVPIPFLIAFPFGWLLSIVAAMLFLAIDYWSPPVADNIINPVIITVVLELLALFLQS